MLVIFYALSNQNLLVIIFFNFHMNPIWFMVLAHVVLVPSVEPISNINTLVYKNCTAQTLTDISTNTKYSQTMSSIFQELIPQSSFVPFYKTNSTTSNKQSGLTSGLFQCRGDLTLDDCHSCVKTLPDIMSNNSCASARVQLGGCYFNLLKTDHEASDTHNPDHNWVLHKVCSEEIAEDKEEFLQARDDAFEEMESQVAVGSDHYHHNHNGFFTARYESLEVTAQCQGDLGDIECEKCVRIAIQIAEEECGFSISGQIYLDSCYVSFVQGEDDDDDDGGKKLAIILGGAAAALLGLIFLKSIMSWREREDCK